MAIKALRRPLPHFSQFEGLRFQKSAQDIRSALQNKIDKVSKELSDKRARLAKLVPEEELTEEALINRFYEKATQPSEESQDPIQFKNELVFRLAAIVDELTQQLDMCERILRNLPDGTYDLSYADLEALGL